MPSLRDITSSSIGKKLISGLTGLLLCGFIVGHLTGNLLLLVGQEAFNEYAHFLHSVGHGYLVPLAEIGLLALFGAHAIAGIQVALDRRRARTDPYIRRGNAGGASHKTLASRSMILSGLVLLVFVIVHVGMFRFGIGAPRQYADVLIDGHASRDLYSLVVDWFHYGPATGLYVLVMLILGNHLRHGFWSAFQSLGANNPKFMPLIHGVGLVFATIMTLGFLAIPIYIFLFVDPTGGGPIVAG